MNGVRGFAPALAFSLSAAGGALSEPLPVYTGEHGTFTRVVVTLPENGAWTLTPATEDVPARLSVPAASDGYDLSGVWQRIGRGRVGNLRTGPTPESLLIDLACKCTIDAALHDGRHLVMDVAPGTGDAIGGPRPALPDLPLPAVANTASLEVADSLGRLPYGHDANDGDDNGDATIEVGIVEARAEDLVRTFASAVGAGLLAADDRVGVLRRIDGLVPMAAPVTLSKPTLVNPEVSGPVCGSYGFLDMRRGAAETPSYDDVTRARSSLLGGSGRIDPDRLNDLIEAYLSLGLGKEAIPLLEIADRRDRDDLLLLARLMEAPYAQQAGLAARLACGNEDHVWAIFDDGTPTASLDSGAIVSSFDTWSQQIQAHLGPPLMRQLRKRSQEATAHRLASRLERSDVTRSDALRLERARLSPAPPSDMLSALKSSPDEEVAAEALRDLVAAATDPGAARELATLAGTLAKEHRGSPQEAGLFAAEVAALAESGAYAEAYATLEAEPSRAGDSRADLVGKIVDAALADADNARSLDFLVSREEALAASEGLDDRQRLGIAARMLEGGLAERTLDQLRTLSGEEARRERRLLEARAALELREPEDAEIALIGLTGTDVETLRGRAREMMGDFAFITTRADAAVPETLRRDAAILAGNWELVADTGDQAWAEAARLMQGAGPEATLDAARLAAFEEVAARSANVRAALETLLAQTELPEE